jgi:hypothetical protein
MIAAGRFPQCLRQQVSKTLSDEGGKSCSPSSSIVCAGPPRSTQIRSHPTVHALRACTRSAPLSSLGGIVRSRAPPRAGQAARKLCHACGRLPVRAPSKCSRYRGGTTLAEHSRSPCDARNFKRRLCYGRGRKPKGNGQIVAQFLVMQLSTCSAVCVRENEPQGSEGDEST